MTAPGLLHEYDAAVSKHSDSYKTISLGDDDYPELLTQLRDPPPILYVRGNVDALHLPSLAIVGSRNPTSGGARNAFEFSRHLARSGFCIVSGLAQGIDAAAHRGALEADAVTVAILGNGIDTVYPASNRELADAIVVNGALVSEYPPGTPPLRAYFPQRNRLISGLSLGTLVVEAARRSGSLITARLASEQGREVFALPGSIHNPMARGCHQLLRDGARLVESVNDIMAEIAPLAGHLLQTSVESTHKQDTVETNDEEYVNLLRSLGHDPIGIDELVARSGLTIDQVSSMLLILELDGKIEKLSGGRYALLH
jgi:DNA processing protein